MSATLMKSTDIGAPAMGNDAGGFFDALAWALLQHGWQVVFPNDDDITLEITPAAGGAGTLRLEKVSNGNYFSYKPIVLDLFSGGPLPLQTLPEIQAKVIGNLTASAAWHTDLSASELTNVFSATGHAGDLPQRPNTPFARLSPEIQARLVENLAAGNDWFSDLNNEEFTEVFEASNVGVSALINLGDSLTAGLKNKILSNYWSGQPFLSGLTSAEIETLIGLANINFSESDTDLTPTGGAYWTQQLPAGILTKINANITAGAAWHTDLSRDEILTVILAADISFAETDFNKEHYQFPENIHPGAQDSQYVIVADEKSVVMLSGLLSGDAAVFKYEVSLAFGTILNPGSEPWFFGMIGGNGVVGREYYFSDSGVVSELTPNLFFSDTPATSSAPWVIPPQVYQNTGSQNYPVMKMLGVIPHIERPLGYMDPAIYPNGTEIAPNRFFFYLRDYHVNGIVLRLTDVPLTSLA
jgi:hypothetical protein